MPVRKIRPLSNSRRNTILPDYRQIAKSGSAPKSLLRRLKNKSGRDFSGQISIRHRGGRPKRKYRLIDFKRNKLNIFGTVTSREYDPNRNCYISLIVYPDGDKRYILTPSNLKIGDQVVSTNNNAEITPGNAMPLEKIPGGTLVHNIELRPGQGGLLMRAAGTSAQILGFDETQKYVIVKLNSSETRKILKQCRATVGVVGNEESRLVRLGKAGRQRWAGIRPTVRGAAMNRVDHPHGGGEGKAPIGHSGPRTKWGKKALGVKTRNRKLSSSELILRRRKTKK